MKKCFEVTENVKKLKFEGELVGHVVTKKYVCWDNHGQNIPNKLEKFSIIGQKKKSLISAFLCFWLLKIENGHWAMYPMKY